MPLAFQAREQAHSATAKRPPVWLARSRNTPARAWGIAYAQRFFYGDNTVVSGSY
jgi:hypothetical protein